MKTPFNRAINCAAFFVTFLTAPVLWAQLTPKVVSSSKLTVAPYNSTGLLFTEVAGNGYRGSASVARDPRLLYTCAHVIYEDGIWGTTGSFARATSSVLPPADSAFVQLRGFRYYSTYSGRETAGGFAKDFAIGYARSTTNFGPALPVLNSGGASLQSDLVSKLIIGYPAEFFATSTPGYYFMYETGPFTNAMLCVKGSFHIVDGVTTGRGNSGGPVVVDIDGAQKLAGILVAGSTDLSGIHGLNSDSTIMADLLIADLDGVVPEGLDLKTVANTKSTRLPDGSRSYSARTLNISGLGESTVVVNIDLRIATPFRGDLDVYVRSPAGRIQWLNQHSLSTPGRDLTLTDANYRSSFYGYNPNGKWSLFMRDFYEDDEATFKNVSLSIGTPKS